MTILLIIMFLVKDKTPNPMKFEIFLAYLLWCAVIDGLCLFCLTL